jgi:hypothetical protein
MLLFELVGCVASVPPWISCDSAVAKPLMPLCSVPTELISAVSVSLCELYCCSFSANWALTSESTSDAVSIPEPVLSELRICDAAAAVGLLLVVLLEPVELLLVDDVVEVLLVELTPLVVVIAESPLWN